MSSQLGWLGCIYLLFSVFVRATHTMHKRRTKTPQRYGFFLKHTTFIKQKEQKS